MIKRLIGLKFPFELDLVQNPAKPIFGVKPPLIPVSESSCETCQVWKRHHTRPSRHNIIVEEHPQVCACMCLCVCEWEKVCEWVSEWVSEWMSEWDGRTDRQKNRETDRHTYSQTLKQTHVINKNIGHSNSGCRLIFGSWSYYHG